MQPAVVFARFSARRKIPNQQSAAECCDDEKKGSSFHFDLRT